MATVGAFEIDGLKLWFWSEDHNPPHFHAKRSGEWEVKVRFLYEPSEMIEEVWTKNKPSRKALKKLATLAEQHRVALLEQWEEIHKDG
jgi:hypothetical protein